MLAVSQLEGYQQFDTVRKIGIRSSFLTAFEPSPEGRNLGNLALKVEKGRTYTMHSMPTESHLFTHFANGLLSRMGRLVIGIVHALLLKHLDKVVTSTTNSWVETGSATMAGTYYCTLFGNSLTPMEDLCKCVDYVKNELIE